MGGCGGGCGDTMGSSPVKWGRVTAVTPGLMVQFSGDTVSVPIDLANSDATFVVNDDVVLVEVAPRRWAAIARFA